MAETNTCLHCHLIAEMKRWADEHLQKDSAGRPIVGDGTLAGAVVSVLRDAVIFEAAEGQDRIRLANEASLTYGTAIGALLVGEPETNPYSRAGRVTASVPAGASVN